MVDGWEGGVFSVVSTLLLYLYTVPRSKLKFHAMKVVYNDDFSII